MAEKNEQQIDLALMEPVFERYADQKGALIPVLQQAQAIYGWLPQEALKLISDRMDMALSRVYGVATFYSQFYMERRGRHVIRLCDGTACHVKGTPALINTVEEELGVGPGETTEDYEYTVEVVYCLGSCALAPVVVMDDEVMGRMRQDTLLQSIREGAAAEGEAEN